MQAMNVLGVVLCGAMAMVAGCFAADPPGPEFDCARSYCGCWEDRTLAYAAVVSDEADGTPIAGIEVRCAGETDLRATSDAGGNVAFELPTRYSPGCNYQNCTVVEFSDPRGLYAPATRTVFESTQVQLSALWPPVGG